MIKDFKEIRKFPHYSQLSEESLKELSERRVPFTPATLDGDELLRVVFAPDPFTGHPSSDFAYIMSKDKNSEIAKYIEDTLHRPIPDNRTEDGELALASVKSRYESLQDYYDRLRSFVQDTLTDKDG